MKIFQINWGDGEKECISANTNIEAIKIYCHDMQFDVWDFEDDTEIIEIPENEWDNHNVIVEDFYDNENSENNEGKTITFTEWMKQNPEPGYICGTMY